MSKDHFMLNVPQVTEKPFSLRYRLLLPDWNEIDDEKSGSVRLAWPRVIFIGLTVFCGHEPRIPLHLKENYLLSTFVVVIYAYSLEVGFF